MIVKKGSQYCVVSHTTGKSFGCYASREEAKKRLGQIKMFKSMKKSGEVWSEAGK